jgi:2-oxoglutarate ferredoxin oxidoreductase subunit delta
MIVFDARFCTGCGICVRYCPKKILKISDRMNNRGYFMAEITDQEECDNCRTCELYCPDFAVFIVEDEGKNG